MNVPQNNYISVFGRTAGLNGTTFDPSVFSGNGLAILKPSKCDIIENLNGSYSVTLTHPIDKDDIWKNIYVLNFLKVQGQLFRIQSVDASFDGSSGSLTAYAEHIMYLQNDAWILKQNWDFSQNTVSGHSMYELLLSIWEQSIPNGLGGDMKEAIENFFPRFYFTSNVEIPSNVYDPNLGTYLAPIGDGKTRYEMIMDAIARFGGELYRDNFYYSINTRMENAVDNAFDIRVGGNLLGIKRTIDTSKFCTHFRGFYDLDGYQSQKYHAYSSTAGFLNSCVRAKKYNYDDDKSEEHVVPEALLERDISEYFDRNMNPKFTYTIKMKDFLRNPEARLSGSRFKVGDTGKITDERLGIEKTLKIIQTKTNGITGRTEEITLDSSYDFDWGYGHTILPKFPELPMRHDKIAVILLDENMQKTSNIQYVDTLAEVSQILAGSPDNMFHIEAGTQSSVVPYWSFYFTNTDNIYSVKIPEGVKKISKFAFDGCDGLTKVQLPESLEEIEDSGDYAYFMGAFSRCTSLQDINIPMKLKAIPVNAFAYCTALTSIKIPDSQIEIYQTAFYNCTNLASVDFGNSIKKIGATSGVVHGAFENCTSLTSVIIPSSVSEIGIQTFQGCTNLNSATIQEGVSKIGALAFRSCTSLKYLTLSTGIVEIGTSAFSDCQSLQNVEIPDSVLSIGDSSFSYCSSLKTIKLSENITKIGNGTFSFCQSLKSISFPSGITELGAGAFSGCSSLKDIIIPDGVISIGDGAFHGCSSLISIKLPSSIRTLGNSKSSGLGIFRDCTALPTISIPENVSEINPDAFAGCTFLKQIGVQNKRYSLGKDPWGAPNFISTATADSLAEQGKPIPDGKYVADWQGAGSSDDLAEKILIKELNADGTVKRYNTVKSTGYLKEFLQESPDKLYAVDIGALCIGKEGSPTYATITAESFSGITNLKELYIPDTFRTIEADAFTGCTNLDYVQIGGQKGRISGEPWGADSSTDFYYSANLVNLDGATLMAADDIYPYLAVKTQQTNTTYETGLYGVLKVSTESEIPVEKTLYIISETNAFSLKLGDKELKI